MAKPAPPHAVVLGDARITINAIPAQVFEALTNAERLVEWSGDDVRVDAQIGGGRGAPKYSSTPWGVGGEGCVDAPPADSKDHLVRGDCPPNQETPHFQSWGACSERVRVRRGGRPPLFQNPGGPAALDARSRE